MLERGRNPPLFILGRKGDWLYISHMQSIDLMRAIAQTTKLSEKEALIEKAFTEGNREFFHAARLAYDPLVTFGVKKVALIEEDDGQGHYTFDEFLELSTRLSKRELTGHAARDAINSAAEKAPFHYWNDFIRPILLKKFGTGITETTVNKVLKRIGGEALDYIIPVFGTQLAKDGADSKNAKKISGVKYLDVKLDGVRLLSFIDIEQRTVVQYSREGIVLDTFPHLREQLAKLIDLLPESIVLDGEVVSSSFQELMEQLQRKKPDASNARLALFDIIPMKEFREGFHDLSQKERHERLSSMAATLRSISGGAIYVLPKIEVDLDTPHGYATYLDFNKQALAANYEGIMIKDLDAPYRGKRVDAWLKVKPFIELTLKATKIEQGEPDGKYAHTMGNVIFEGIDEGKKVKVSVGSGFSDELRDEIFANPDAFIGMLADIRADALSLARGSEVYSMRFPRFKGWRGIEPGQKI